MGEAVIKCRRAGDQGIAGVHEKAAVLGGSAGHRLRARKGPHGMGVADALDQQGRGKSPGRGWSGSDSNGSRTALLANAGMTHLRVAVEEQGCVQMLSHLGTEAERVRT